jgi:hypothetical protein
MPRKSLIQTPDGSRALLTESKADDESQLQELIKNNPDLLPIEDFGMTGPLMVVGRETSLQSGAVDLAALTRSGEILIIEFKTGPQNTDFRHSLAQLIDYGSDLWSMVLDVFESTVPVRYFASTYSEATIVAGFRSLVEAAERVCQGFSEDESIVFREEISAQLKSGGFHYILVAQRFTPTIERTIEYLNASMTSARFYAVELVRFQGGDGFSAFEARTAVKPSQRASAAAQIINEEQFLDSITDLNYRETIRRFLEAVRGLGFRLEWGSLGVSIRLPTPDGVEPLTVAWLFPPGRAGWMGLTNLAMGFDPWSANQHKDVASTELEKYLTNVAAIPDASPARSKNLKDSAFVIPQARVVEVADRATEILAEITERVNG